MHKTGHSKLVHWDNPEGWDGEGGERGVWDRAPVFTVALFTIAWTWKQPRCPLADEWIRKLWYMHMMEYYLAIKEEFISINFNEVDETGAYYTE